MQILRKVCSLCVDHTTYLVWDVRGPWCTWRIEQQLTIEKYSADPKYIHQWFLWVSKPQREYWWEVGIYFPWFQHVQPAQPETKHNLLYNKIIKYYNIIPTCNGIMSRSSFTEVVGEKSTCIEGLALSEPIWIENRIHAFL